MQQNKKEVKFDHAKYEEELRFKITLLQREIECLRSVLSEIDVPLSCYLQWGAAEAYREVRNYLK